MKLLLRTLVAAGLLASGLTFAIVAKTENKAEAANPNKVTICHRTAAVNNPYRRITVNVSSIATNIAETGAQGGHGQWSHNLWPSSVAVRPDPNVFNPEWKTSVYTTATQKRWGDIIPFNKNDGNAIPANRDARGLNFKDAGLEIYNGTGVYGGLCKRQTAAQFCQSLLAEGGTLADCQAELAEMGADEDKPLTEACGADFSKCSIDAMNFLLNVRSVDVSCIAEAGATTATFSGAASVGTVTHSVSFEYDTDEFMTVDPAPISVSATPATISSSATFTGVASAIANGTYYFRSVAIDPATDSRLDGSIVEVVVNDGVCTATGLDSTAPTEATPTDPPGNSGFNGALKGVVWIDQNRNGKQDSDEPGLPFTPLVANIVTSSVSGQGVGKASAGKTSVRKFAVNATTDANGFYNVPSLEPGSWTVTATLQTSALEKTFDSTNGTTTSWLASALVPVNGVGEADFAAAGNARAALVVEPTATCARAKTVEVQWAGIDNKLNTKDDVVFVATVNQQEALVRGLPWGSYIVTPICADGTRLASQTLIITKAQSTKITKLSVKLAPAALPATGQSSQLSLMALSALLVASGIAMLAVPRRRRRV
jgi:LPXTG-motif cell wall-anchored protein